MCTMALKTMMFSIACIYIAATATASTGVSISKSDTGDQAQAAMDLITRVAGSALAVNFETAIFVGPEKGGFQVSTSATGKVLLQGTTGVEIASAFNLYLNEFLNITVDWNTYGIGQFDAYIASAKPLPRPPTMITKPRVVEYSYYMNVCTYGYSTPFIPWEASDDDTKVQSWVRHIDWMALQGMNLPLSFIGQEWVWTQVFADYNISFAEQQSFYSGPVFLPWFRMGNMRGWGGPITMEWLTMRRDLQIQVLARMRGLGMRPVLSAFAGHIPKSFQTKYPNAKITRSPDWANFDAGINVTAPYADVYMLEPTDPLFAEIGNKFIAAQIQVFGTDNIYNCDTYNEMNPPTNDPGYLANASAAVYAGMTQADPKAIWLMQGWLFIHAWWGAPQIEAYLGGVPTGSMWVLDLFGDSSPVWSKTASFYGHPFIWCTLLNFGGQQGMLGNVPQITSGLEKAVSNSTINGIGITMEGIWTNYPVFEITLQSAYTNFTTDVLPEWWSRYGSRRYGPIEDATALAAVQTTWSSLGSSVYAGAGGGFGSAISSVPGHPTPPPTPVPEPMAPPGFKTYAKRGYFEGYIAANPLVQDVTTCAATCMKMTQPKCLGFEVYIDVGAAGGNCYLFPTINTSFFELDPCATYLRTDDAHMNQLNDVQRVEPVQQQQDYMSSRLPTDVVKRGPDLSMTDVFTQTWQELLSINDDKLNVVPSFRFDLVDVGREVISSYFSQVQGEFDAAYTARNVTATTMYGQQLLTIIDDYDLLLSTDTNFMLGRWLEWSKNWSAVPANRENLEMNARNIITLWGPTGQINDYAKKEWGGLVRAYYKARWELFITMSTDCLSKNQPWSQDAYTTQLLNTIELPFQTDTTVFPTTPESDAITTSQMLFKKYGGGAK
eukprot:m.69908 g.69908  ORF g.69908 m.69908 type:complete len:890 (+) comp24154_c0_seq1:29-2698(+)